MKRLVLLLPLAFLMISAGVAQPHQDLMNSATRDLLKNHLSGEIAKEHVIAITRHHRIQGSRGYRDAANYVLGRLRAYGLTEQDAFIESYPSDGKKVYQTWQSPSGWDIRSAELEMVSPSRERIVGYPEIAMSVMTYSNPGDVTAELVWVGEGTHEADYAGKDVRGKIVLATGYGGDVHRLAVLKYGARAVVCYLDDDRAKTYPDMLQYTGLWPRTEELPRVTFGFNLTKRQGDRLRDLLLAGTKVVLHGKVEGTGLEPYFMDVVVARIPGTEQPDREIVFTAHLDHPKESANDNASGSGAILDIVRSLKSLIDEHLLPRPRRSLRFLWVPEWNGTMAYIDRHVEFRGPRLEGSVLADLNLDMVGEHPELLHSQLYLTRTPASIPSCLNEVIENMAGMTDRLGLTSLRGSRAAFNYRISPYTGGSDHMMCIDRKIPAVMFSHSDYTHHTSEDTPDKVDQTELLRNEMIAAGTAWYLANLDSAEAVDLASLVYERGADRLAAAARKAIQLPPSARPSERSDLLDFQQRVELEEMGSILEFNASPQARRAVGAHLDQIKVLTGMLTRSLAESLPPGGTAPDRPEPTDSRVPIRTTRGPLDFGLPERKLDSAAAAWYRSPAFTLDGDARFELVNFVDGKKTVSAIAAELNLEFGQIPAEEVAHYIEDLVKTGALGWR
ncbi:MAG TPA: DUF4910 domain-containing protein [Bacteroidota bacterium]|nr:DUF4910 domain-containing protein [Bacteroidota bacterium]